MADKTLTLPASGQDGIVVVPKGSEPYIKNYNAAHNRMRVGVRPYPVIVPVPPVDVPPDPIPDPPSFPYPSLQAALNATPVGGTLVVPEGKVFTETIDYAGKTMRGAGTGFRIDGQNQRPYGAILRKDATADLFEVVNCKPPTQDGAVRLIGDRAHVSRLHTHHHKGDGTGITVRDCDLALIEDIESDHVEQACFHSTNTTNAVWRRFHFHDANADHSDAPGWEAGAGKVTASRKVLFEDGLIHDIYGHGLWSDDHVVDFTYRRVKAHHISHSGFFGEISTTGLIEDCAAWECGWGDTDNWAFGAGVQASSTDGVVIRRFTSAWNNRGISVLSQNRPDNPSLVNHDNQLTDNVVVSANGQWVEQWVSDRGPVMFAPAQGNRGSGSRIWVPTPDPQGQRFEWAGPKSRLSDYAATPGGTGARYITTAERDALLTAAGVPLVRT